MAFSPDIAAKRFGYGLSPSVASPASVGQMLDGVRGPDGMQTQYPVGTFYDVQSQYVLFQRFRKHARERAGTPEGDASFKKQLAVSKEVTTAARTWFGNTMLRRITTPDGFRERLVAFWADHFTAYTKVRVLRRATPVYIEEAVRPLINGRFADLLASAVRHPLMLNYLDQDYSVGPNSRYATRRDATRGLNENLAREVLELHTLGVDGPYTQKDVRALANLFTGLTRSRDFSFQFRSQLAEPGGQEVLGTQYSDKISIERIDAVLRDLARHPATAAHIARKLAVHFVSDVPPADLVGAMTQAYLDSDGDLMAVYGAMLDHPQSWDMPARNIRPPDEFISASLRALDISPLVFQRMGSRTLQSVFTRPLKLMGQEWQRPTGPDGWDEQDDAWVTPQGVAGRVEWAMRAPKTLLKVLPDPREVVHQALGPTAPPKVVFAADAAESRAEAIGLILMSPAFQRR